MNLLIRFQEFKAHNHMSSIITRSDISRLSRRDVLRLISSSVAFAAMPSLRAEAPVAKGAADSLTMQLYKSLTAEQSAKIVLARDHAKRGFVSNWWYICPDQQLHTFFSREQQDLVKQIYESLHHPEHREKMNWQVEHDLMGDVDNTPSVGFFGKPDDEDFEFIYTGHHVTRRCFAGNKGVYGFGGRPIFYGNFAKAFREEKDHAGNPFWYQGLIFNEFVSSLDGAQRAKLLVGAEPRSEKPAEVIARRADDLPGIAGSDLTKDQQEKLILTMRRMLVCFRPEDVDATIKIIESKKIVERLFVSCYGGKYDIGSDQVWDTWQIEGPDMVWYFRGYPHIHGYFHLAAV